MKACRIITTAALLMIAYHTSWAQQEKYWINTDSLFKFVKPVASLQFWSIYTMGEQDKITPTGNLEPVQDRLNFMVRRARFGFNGNPYKRLSYTVMIQYDNVGKDKLSGARGNSNTGQFGLLDVYATVRVSNNDMAHITFGYFQPQFSRECITADLSVNSFDKSPSQTYIRQHLDGRSYGRATGLNVGGSTKPGVVTINYNVGIFNNNTTATDQTTTPESTGKYWSPLLVERVTISFGDADKKKYSINYGVNNSFNERKGITLGIANSHQGKTETFNWNRAYGADLLFNYNHFNIDAEWFWLSRQLEGTTYLSATGHVRAGYNMIVGNKLFLEPCFMAVGLNGDDGSQFSGRDRYYDAGVNWYLNKKSCKVSAHYIIQNGHGKNGYTDGTTFKKGNYAGVSLVLMM